jgi:hypothetical protein
MDTVVMDTVVMGIVVMDTVVIGIVVMDTIAVVSRATSTSGGIIMG